MSDQTAIATKLAALAAQGEPFKDGHRVISHDLPALAAILREIDDTVLERTLVFGIGATAVHAVVAGRRLRGIVEISTELQRMDAVVGQVLSREDPETLAALGAILKQLCATAPNVTVHSAPARALGSSAEAGVSTAVLASAWDIDPAAKPQSPMARLLTANALHITASLHVVDGQPPQTTGDATALQTVWGTQVTSFRKRHKSLLGKQDGPMLVCLKNALPDQGLALVVADGEQCLISCPAGRVTDLVTSWNAIIGT